MTQYELIVLGSGRRVTRRDPGGQARRRVAIVERLACVGGVCINRGTIPSKSCVRRCCTSRASSSGGLYGHSYRVKQTITIQDLMFRCTT